MNERQYTIQQFDNVRANKESWLDHLEMLLVQFSHLGLSGDIQEMSLIELWGLYCYLSRME